MSTPEITFALGLKPAAAVEWLKAKGVTAENYRNLTASEIAKVYTIARISDLEMLNDIKQSMITAADNGQSYQNWRKDILQHLQNKGWLHPNGHNGKDIIDPQTGEVFGAPRRLETIYRTNMQSAYMAGQYQGYMANIGERPYWMYDAVGDSRTRPAHAAMDGLVYRYDDPFWATFYPPNGYNCRCSVMALVERDLAKYGVALSESGEHNFVETNKIYNKKGDTYPTMAYKAPDGSLHTTDRGFDYNAGRMNYRPDLDKYDRALAHQFAKAEMHGAEFRATFKQLGAEFEAVKNRLGMDGKLSNTQLYQIEDMLTNERHFAAGVVAKEMQQTLGLGKATVWLSDDTINKQANSRKDEAFPVALYGHLPDIYHAPDAVVLSRKNSKYYFFKQIDGKWYLAVTKYLYKKGELFMESFRRSDKNQLDDFSEKYERLK